MKPLLVLSFATSLLFALAIPAQTAPAQPSKPAPDQNKSPQPR